MRIAEPEEKHGSTNDNQVTAVARGTSPNPEKVGDRHQEDIIPVNPILESWGEDRTATELSTTAHGVDWVIEESDLPLNGFIAPQQWRVRGPIGQHSIERQNCSNMSHMITSCGCFLNFISHPLSHGPM